MEHYFVFAALAALTILSPGPGVLLTLSNSIRFGFNSALSGIMGVAFGTFAVAAVSATGLGLLLSVSTIAFTIMKYIGAAYLIYLGLKLWCSNGHRPREKKSLQTKNKMRFLEGVTIQVTNPKAVFFFLSVFPQFIDYSVDFTSQFLVLVITYSVLVVMIHVAYALVAVSARDWLSTPECSRIFDKIGGGTFICFGVGLATANK